MKAIIMAGGEGTRLRPLTCDLPKPMVPLMDKPVMEHIINLLKKHGFDDIAVTLGYLPQEITEYFKDGSSFGVKLGYFCEEKPLGTAGGARNAWDENSRVLVISGDCVSDINLTDALRFHKENNAALTIITKRVGIPIEYGVVVTEEDGRVKRFLEKPQWSEIITDNANTGIYIIEPEVMNLIPKDKKFDFSKELFPKLLGANIPIYAFETDGYWCDIGDTAQYMQAHIDIFDAKCIIEQPASGLLLTNSDAELLREFDITPPVYIADDARLQEMCKVGPYAVIGKAAMIASNASIKHSVVWQGSKIGEACEIRGSIICSGVSIKNRCRTFEGSVIGSGTVVGQRSVIRPGVKIWPCKRIGDGEHIWQDIVWGNVNAVPRCITGQAIKEITPQYGALLGEAVGVLVSSGSKAAIACTQDAGACAIRLGVCAGLCTAGIKAIDLGTAALPSLRYAITKNECSAGIYIRHENGTCELRVLDDNANDINKDAFRKIKGYIDKCVFMPQAKPEFARAMPGADLEYALHVTRRFTSPKPARVMVCGQGAKLVDAALRRCGHQVTSSEENVDSPGVLTKALGCAFGIQAAADGQTFILYDADGNKCTGREVQALMIFAAVYGAGLKKVYIPDDAPLGLVQYADLLMAERASEPDRDINESASGFACALAKALSIAEENIQGALDELVPAGESSHEIQCEPSEIGMVMRSLWQHPGLELSGKGVALKIKEAQVRIEPDISLPGIRVTGSAFLQETAEEIAGIIAHDINEIIKNNLEPEQN